MFAMSRWDNWDTGIKYTLTNWSLGFRHKVGSWEGLPDNCQELFAYVGLYIFAVGWIKPSNFPIPSLVSGGIVPCIGVKF